MNRIKPVMLGLVALALAVVPSAAQAQGRSVVAHDVAQSPSEVRAYWTAERMRNAKPRDPRQPNGKPSGSGGGGGGGGGGSYGAVTLSGGAYTGLNAMNGKVFFTERGVNYVCSGTSISTSTAAAVWTAGHCVNEGPGAFVTNWQFVPAYLDGSAPYGFFPATTLYTTAGWRGSGDWSYDLGAATVSGNLGSAVGGRNILTGANPNGLHVVAYGYPAAGAKFNGQRQYFCDSTVKYLDGGNPQPMGIPCNMTGGSSGGAWINDSGFVVSVNSYGYQSLKNVMFGPQQNSVAATLASCARNTGCNAAVTSNAP